MSLTLEYVLSHPAYKRYVLPLTKAEIRRMQAIVNLVELCDRVKYLYKRYNLTVQVPADDNPKVKHYKECVWAKPDCKEGPDTCVCTSISFSCYQIMDGLKLLSVEDSGEKEEETV